MDAYKLNLNKKHKRDQRTAPKVAGVDEIAPNGNMDIINTARMNTATSDGTLQHGIKISASNLKNRPKCIYLSVVLVLVLVDQDEFRRLFFS